MADAEVMSFDSHPMDVCCSLTAANVTADRYMNESIHLHCVHECMLDVSARIGHHLIQEGLGAPSLFFAFYVIIVAVACVGNGVVCVWHTRQVQMGH